MVAKFLDINEPWSWKYARKKNEIIDTEVRLSCHDCTQEQNDSPYFLPSFNNANGRLCRETLLSSRKFVNLLMAFVQNLFKHQTILKELVVLTRCFSFYWQLTENKKTEQQSVYYYSKVVKLPTSRQPLLSDEVPGLPVTIPTRKFRTESTKIAV